MSVRYQRPSYGYGSYSRRRNPSEAEIDAKVSAQAESIMQAWAGTLNARQKDILARKRDQYKAMIEVAIRDIVIQRLQVTAPEVFAAPDDDLTRQDHLLDEVDRLLQDGSFMAQFEGDIASLLESDVRQEAKRLYDEAKAAVSRPGASWVDAKWYGKIVERFDTDANLRELLR